MPHFTGNTVYSVSKILKLQAHCGFYTYFLISSYPKQGWLCSPSKSDIFYFPLLCSLSCKSFLPSIPFWSSLKGDFSLHEVLNKICITEIVFFNLIPTVVGDEGGIWSWLLKVYGMRRCIGKVTIKPLVLCSSCCSHGLWVSHSQIPVPFPYEQQSDPNKLYLKNICS